MSNVTNETCINEHPFWFNPTLNTICAVTFLVGFPVNCVIIYLVRRLRSLKSPTFHLVASLAFADLLVLVYMVFYMAVYRFINHTFHIKIQNFLVPSLDMFLAAASMLNVACVSLDRAIAVVMPLHYDQHVTKRKTHFAIMGVWIYSIVVFILGIMRARVDDPTYQTALLWVCFALSYFVPVITLVTCYTAILICAIRNLKFTKSWEKAVNNTRVRVDGSESQNKVMRRANKSFRELRVTGNLLIMVVPFTVGWTYFVGTHIYEEVLFIKSQSQNESDTDACEGYDWVHEIFMNITPWILSGLNPILYFFLTRSIRQGFVTHIRRMCYGHGYDGHTSNTSTVIFFTRRSQARNSKGLNCSPGSTVQNPNSQRRDADDLVDHMEELQFDLNGISMEDVSPSSRASLAVSMQPASCSNNKHLVVAQL